MKAIVLVFVLVSSFSFGQNTQNRISHKKEMKISKSNKEEKDVRVILSGKESMCDIIQSLDKQFQNQGLVVEKKQLEEVGVYLFNTINPNIGDDIGDKKQEGKKFRIKFSLRLNLKDGKFGVNVNLDICIDTEGNC